MTSPGPAATILLVLATVVCLLSSIGILVMRGVYDKLHYLAPAAILGTGAVVAAVIVEEGFGSSAIKALLVLLVMLISNPVLTHAAARANRLRERRKQGKCSKGGITVTMVRSTMMSDG